MKKFLPFLILLLAACSGDDEKTNGDSSQKDSATNQTSVKHDSAVFYVDSLGLPAGVTCKVNGKRVTYTINDTTGLDSLFVDEVYGETGEEIDDGPDSLKNSMPDWDIKTMKEKMDYLYVYPGSFSQMCAETFDISYMKKFTYPYFMGNGFTVTVNRFEKLRAQRDSVVHYFLTAKKGKRLNTYDLQIIMDMNIVEMLPRIVAQEKLLRRLAFACADSMSLRLSSSAQKAFGRYYSVSSRVLYSYQYLISTMAVLLRQEKSKELLSSVCEHEYAVAMKPGKDDITSADKIPAENKQMLFFDPLLKRAVASYDYIEMSFDEDHVGQIVKAAENYINFTPADVKAAAAQRMNPWPVDR